MYTERDILQTVHGITTRQLRIWISRDWVRPVYSCDGFLFNDADAARIQLIASLLNDMKMGNEAIPVILSLIDQCHSANRCLDALTSAVNQQNETVRAEILRCMSRLL